MSTQTPETSDPTQCSGDEGFCPEHGFHRHSLKQPGPTKTRPGDQPLPVGGRECVQDALIADIQARRDIGIQRYGSALMTHNGRDAIQDAVEEALDLAVYLKQVALETRDREEQIATLCAEKEGRINTTADALCAELHRRAKRLDRLEAGSRVREQVYGEVLGLRGAVGIALGSRVPGGSADDAGINYYEAWLARAKEQQA